MRIRFRSSKKVLVAIVALAAAGLVGLAVPLTSGITLGRTGAAWVPLTPEPTGAAAFPTVAAEPETAVATETGTPPSSLAQTPSEQTPTASVEAIARASLSLTPGTTITSPAVGASPTGTDTPTLLPSPTATMTRTPTPSPTSTPSATVVPTLTATPLPSPTATPLPAEPTATRTRERPSSPTPVPVEPVLVEPAPGTSGSGRVIFRWQPEAPLPPGAAYEVVMWNSGEDPASARGVAATTTDKSLTADLDAMFNLGLLGAGEAFWTVLIVETDPYVRLTKPAGAHARILNYQPPGGEPGGGPPPPKP